MITTKHIGPKLKCINISLKQHLCKDGQELNLTSAQMHVLRYLCIHQEDVIYQKDILNEFDLSNATISGIISRLENKGFVLCCSSESDSRCKQIKITDKALACNHLIEQNIKRTEAQMVKGFSDEDIARLHQYLEKIQYNLNNE